jgi:hypothetical protein
MKLRQIRRIWNFSNSKGVIPGTKLGKKWLPRFEKIGFTDMVLVVNDPNNIRTKFSVYSQATLDNMKKIKARLPDVDLHIMTWLKPSKSQIKQSADVLFPLAETIEARSIMIDAEKPWTKGWRALSASQRSAVRKTFKAEYRSAPCCLCVTYISSATVLDKVQPLIDLCQYSLPQAYSSMKPKAAGTFKAPKLQESVIDNAKKSGNAIVMGLASYDLPKLGLKRKVSAMRADLDATENQSHVIQEVAYWRLSGFFMGDKKGKLAFIKEACAAAKAGGPVTMPLCSFPGTAFN